MDRPRTSYQPRTPYQPPNPAPTFDPPHHRTLEPSAGSGVNIARAPYDVPILERAYVDFAPAVDACILLSNGTDALAAFEETAPREWQMHSFFLPSCRGRKAIDTAKEMLAWMIPARADRVWGGTPLTNKAARWFNRQIGGASIGFDEFEVEGPVEIFEMRAA